MAKTRKPKSAAPKKLDPAKATIYVAVVTLLGGSIVALISNVDKLRALTPPNAQAEEIVAFQEHRYSEISQALEERANQAREEEKKLTASSKARRVRARATAVRQYIEDNSYTKAVLAQKHGEFTTVVRLGDLFKANVIKTEVNTLLGKERESYRANLGNTKGTVPLLDTPSYCLIPRSDLIRPHPLEVTSLPIQPASEVNPPVRVNVVIPQPRRHAGGSKAVSVP